MNVLADVIRAAPRADMQSMPDAWAEPEATSRKYENPVAGHSRPATSQVRLKNVAIWPLDTDSDGENVLAVTPSAVVLATEVPKEIPSLPTRSMLWA